MNLKKVKEKESIENCNKYKFIEFQVFNLLFEPSVESHPLR